MRDVAVAALLATAFILGGSAAALGNPIEPNVETDISLTAAAAERTLDGVEIDRFIDNVSNTKLNSGVVTDARIMCGEGADDTLCTNPQYCAAPPGSVRNTIFRSTDAGVTFEAIGEACLLPAPQPDPVDAPPQVTPDLVAQAFATLTWPESPLTIQPPGGRTLVNLKTNFLTTNTTPTTQTVQLLGQSVDIEATPTTWTWIHGDGTTQTTDQPGTPYPDLTITHTYQDADTTATPAVDTTYTGRYRINQGPWQPIPTTRTITGTPGELDIVPATPQLVATP